MDDLDSIDRDVEDIDIEDLALEEIDLIGEANRDKSDALDYPCMLVEGMETKAELDFIMKNRGFDSSNSIPLYINFNGLVKKIGRFGFDLDYIFLLRGIAKYSFTLCKSKDEKSEIDLNDTDVLVKFIRL